MDSKIAEDGRLRITPVLSAVVELKACASAFEEARLLFQENTELRVDIVPGPAVERSEYDVRTTIFKQAWARMGIAGREAARQIFLFGSIFSAIERRVLAEDSLESLSLRNEITACGDEFRSRFPDYRLIAEALSCSKAEQNLRYSDKALATSAGSMAGRRTYNVYHQRGGLQLYELDTETAEYLRTSALRCSEALLGWLAALEQSIIASG